MCVFADTFTHDALYIRWRRLLVISALAVQNFCCLAREKKK